MDRENIFTLKRRMDAERAEQNPGQKTADGYGMDHGFSGVEAPAAPVADNALATDETLIGDSHGDTGDFTERDLSGLMDVASEEEATRALEDEAYPEAALEEALMDEYQNAEIGLGHSFEAGDSGAYHTASARYEKAARALREHRARHGSKLSKLAYGEQPRTPSSDPDSEADRQGEDLYSRINQEYGTDPMVEPEAISEAVNKAQSLAQEQGVYDDEEILEHARFFLGTSDQRMAYRYARNADGPLVGIDGSQVKRSERNPNRFFDEAGREYELNLRPVTAERADNPF